MMTLSSTSPLIIAVDGPAASGKGTIARLLARHFGLPHLDTGLLYRAVGLAVRDANLDPDDPEAAAQVAQALSEDNLKDEARLRGDEAGQMASKVARHGPVRQALLQWQRDFAAQPGGAVLDGRDIGTVICPQATVKLFIEAQPEVRAARRLQDLLSQGVDTDQQTVLADLRARDARDMARADAPLRMAADAHLIDTTELDIDTAFDAARRCVELARSGAEAR